MTPEARIEQVITGHETHWSLAAFTLRALDTDEEAGHFLRRHVRHAMAVALLAGYEGHEATPKLPPVDAHRKAEEWIGMQLLRDIGPRGLAEINWITLGGRMTLLAGRRVTDRQRKEAGCNALVSL